MRYGIIILFLLLSATTVMGATIKGNIYNYDLTPLKNVKIDIDTQPHQTFIAVEGKYSIDVPTGEYTLIAKKYGNQELISEAKETILVETEGEFNLDLILFPELTQEQELMDANIPEVEDVVKFDGISPMTYFLTAIIVGAFGFVLYYTWQSRKILKQVQAPSEMDEMFDYEAKVLVMLKKAGGRMTQKEIRKQIPLSEAKISMIISGLELDGKVDKLKVGRGNIVKLR